MTAVPGLFTLSVVCMTTDAMPSIGWPPNFGAEMWSRALAGRGLGLAAQKRTVLKRPFPEEGVDRVLQRGRRAGDKG